MKTQKQGMMSIKKGKYDVSVKARKQTYRAIRKYGKKK